MIALSSARLAFDQPLKASLPHPEAQARRSHADSRSTRFDFVRLFGKQSFDEVARRKR